MFKNSKNHFKNLEIHLKNLEIHLKNLKIHFEIILKFILKHKKKLLT